MEEYKPLEQIKNIQTGSVVSTAEHLNFYQVIEGSHFWSEISQLIQFLQYQKDFHNGNVDIDYLIKGLTNTLQQGYDIRKLATKQDYNNLINSLNPPDATDALRKEKDDAGFDRRFFDWIPLEPK